MAVDLLIHSIGELATPHLDNVPAHGSAMGKINRTKNAAVGIADGIIVACGSEKEVLAKCSITDSTKKIDAEGRLVTPGLVDPHTHLIFAGNRADEFGLRCQGKTYKEIAEAGGGIVASMRATRNASVDELVSLGKARLKRMLESGTTSCEVKTGYGLSTDSELRMFEAIFQLNEIQPVELVPTFMAAHAFPSDQNREKYIEDITERMLPLVSERVSRSSANGRATVFNDVFCDEGYFTLDETKKILEAGVRHGLTPKVHSDEFTNLGATTLAVNLKAQSADHLLNVSDAEIDLLAKSNTVAVLLPGTSFFLNLNDHARARLMIDSGVAVALGSDFNPGSCHIYSLPFIWGLACLKLKMTSEEALTAMTANAAQAIGLGNKIGQIKTGYQADLVIFDLSSISEVPYNLASNPVASTIKRGKIVFDKKENG